MDISSKYFSSLKKFNRYWFKNFADFIVDTYKVGKINELISFCFWEINHRFYIYKISRKYIRFTNASYNSLNISQAQSKDSHIKTEALSTRNLSFRLIDIDWKYCYISNDGTIWGFTNSNPDLLQCSVDNTSITLVYKFTNSIRSFYVTKHLTLFVCSEGKIYRSDDKGATFSVVLVLSTPISYFLYNNGMTELPDNCLIIGEYGSIWKDDTWQKMSYLYYSKDDGKNWYTADFLLRQGVNKHVHIVKYSSLLKSVVLTDGDNKKQLWLSTVLSDFHQFKHWKLVNRYHHHTGGYTSMAETSTSTLFGSDYLGGTNFIVSTSDGKSFKKQVLPDPYRHSPIMNMVTRQSTKGCEIWASSYSCLSSKAKSLLMFTEDSGNSWNRIIDFDGTVSEISIISSCTGITEELYISVNKYDTQLQNYFYNVYKLCSDDISI